MGDMAPNDKYPLAGRRIKLKPAGTLNSPAFTRPYPRVFNKELIEPVTRAWIEGFWTTNSFEERDLEVFSISGAYVVEENMIFDPELQLIENASNEYTDEQVDRALRDILKAEAEGTLPRLSKPTIMAKRGGSNNYGHFMMEALPMAVLASQLFESQNARYLVYRADPPMLDVMFRAYRLLGINLDQLLVQGYREPMHFDQLIVVRGIAELGTYMSPLSIVATEKMAKKVYDYANSKTGRTAEKIFVMRPPGLSRKRALLNQDELIARLSARGFLAVDPGVMTLEQQIMTFYGADQVVGVAGAAMSNIAFCKQGTNVTLLFPAMMADTFFWFIASHKELGYTEIRCKHTIYEGIEPWGADLTISEVDIRCLESL